MSTAGGQAENLLGALGLAMSDRMGDAIVARAGHASSDAIALSALHLANTGTIPPQEAVRAISLAYLSSIALKFAIAWSVAGWGFARRASIGYACTVLGVAGGLLLHG